MNNIVKVIFVQKTAMKKINQEATLWSRKWRDYRVLCFWRGLGIATANITDGISVQGSEYVEFKHQKC